MFAASTTELFFPKPHTRIITNTVRLTNNTGTDTVIKMRTTSREKFHVRPRLFPLASGQTIEVFVSNRSTLNSNNGETPGGVGTTEIADTDECHAVIHKVPSSSTSSHQQHGEGEQQQQQHNATKIDSNSSVEELQLAWDGGSNIGRVVLKCRISEPTPNSVVSFAQPQPRVSKSPSLPRVGSDGNVAGLPPLHRTPRGAGHSRGPSDASVQFARDWEIQAHRRTHSSTSQLGGEIINLNSVAGSRRMSAASTTSPLHSLESVAGKVQMHERSLDSSVAKLGQLSGSARAASAAVSDSLLDAADSSSSGSVNSSKPVRNVPLSVTVFCMIFSFILGVMLRQSSQVVQQVR